MPFHNITSLVCFIGDGIIAEILRAWIKVLRQISDDPRIKLQSPDYEVHIICDTAAVKVVYQKDIFQLHCFWTQINDQEY